MTTSIELKGAKIAAWVNKKTGLEVAGERFIVAQVEDEQGAYETTFGVIDIRFRTVVNGGGDRSPAILMGCSGIKLLQTRQRRDGRIINMYFAEGMKTGIRIGCQQLSDGVDLFISTQADLVQFNSIE